MAKTWYPTNFSGFYVNGKFYYKLTGIAIGRAFFVWVRVGTAYLEMKMMKV